LLSAFSYFLIVTCLLFLPPSLLRKATDTDYSYTLLVWTIGHPK